MDAAPPFELTWIAKRGAWCARWEGLGLVVAGGEDAPSSAHTATLADLVARWPEVRRAIAAFAAGLGPDGRVELLPRGGEYFPAGTCGFDGELGYLAIRVTDPEQPTRARVVFDTGLPDGYALYEAVLEAGRPVRITASAS